MSATNFFAHSLKCIPWKDYKAVTADLK